jgi:hypothetical protein
MPEERIVKRVYKWKQMLTRPLGRPKNRWEYDIINDMKKLKIKNWTSCIQDSSKWKSYVERPKRSKNEVVAPKKEEKKKHIFLMEITSCEGCNACNNISNPG